jgi:hypothetical protein
MDTQRWRDAEFVRNSWLTNRKQSNSLVAKSN